MSVLDSLASLFAPHSCLGCNREGELLCHACFGALPPLPGRCFGCYCLLSNTVGCPSCLKAAGLDTLQAATGYNGLAKALLVQLKFHGDQSAVWLIARTMLVGRTLPSAALLVHIPATTAHIRQRGYDQAELLARVISHQTGCRRARLLARSGRHHQLGADRAQRLAQLSQSLRISNARSVQGRHIILIDDVLTTGSTLRAAANVLRDAGATQVDALVFAQA